MEEQTSFPNDFQKRTICKALTGLAILVFGSLIVGLVWLTSSILGYLQPVLVPLAVAGIVAYLLDPIVNWLQGKGFSRIKGIASVFGAFTLFFGILFYFVGSKLSEQVHDIFFKEGVTSLGNLESSTLYESKNNSLHGWIMRKAYTKDADAVAKHLQNGGTLIGPHKTRWWLDARTQELTSEEGPAPDDINNLLRSDWNSKIPYEGVDYPDELIALENWTLTRGGRWFSNLGDKSLSWLSSSSGKILGFFGVLIGFAMVPIYLYYFLKESDGIKEGWTDYLPLRASKFKDQVVDTLHEINGYLISFFRGQVLVAFIDGILVGITLTIFNLPYGLLIGVCMAFLGIIPYIGNIICLIPACIIAYFHGFSEPYGIPQTGYIFVILAIFIIVQKINSLVTAPKIVGDSVGLHPMTVIFSMIFWSLVLGGFLGALLAVPLTASVKVLFRHYVWDRQTLETEATA